MRSFIRQKEDRYFPKTLFGLSSLNGSWHVFHGGMEAQGIQTSYREKG